MMRAKEINLKMITRVTTAAVFVLSLGILGATAWFILVAINESSPSGDGSTEEIVVERLNETLLNAANEAMGSKKTAPAAVPKDLRNPFLTITPALPPAPPVSAPSETPAPPETPEEPSTPPSP